MLHIWTMSLLKNMPSKIVSFNAKIKVKKYLIKYESIFNEISDGPGVLKIKNLIIKSRKE